MNWCRAKIFRLLLGGLLFLGSSLLAEVPKIIDLSTPSASHLKIRFDRPIASSLFRNFQINDKNGFRDVYDASAILGVGIPKNLSLGEGVKLRIAQNEATKVRIVLDSPSEIKSQLRIEGDEALISLEGAGSNISVLSLFEGITSETKTPSAASANSPKPTATSTKRPSIQGAGKRIVLDPGHGGKDCGAQGVDGVCEKEVVLSVAKYLSQELTTRGYKVFMTRSKDVFINLRDRTKFANDKEADLFISIHANAVPKDKASKMHGIETYFLSNARSERAKNVAALENKDDIETMNYFSKQSFLNTINSQRMIASNKLAIDIQFGMLRQAREKFEGITDGGVREGPFWVLAGALMPSVLLELGYITHPTEGKRLAQSSYQKLLAQGIADGVDGYFEKNF
ncbi:N-acetylmuramoyl-L-alanine amidase family protein [Wolinella succinogenes]|uniref:N-acetylmuramoyl-L-alanine amidase n=1 Tax=Wolinella succinogenes (strain ATCC 29543 / DSM 1740 / CCUG 13145 / JCM 31913 / LMG 7466 / NCTC 11488 / FDC 602W) TaxID=273121 RepID=Q7MAH5_WOLSU|nr:N-acetylmuramoyl-L-alanine amidase [Wolinella succinogenes]CAE09399.1 N-ACETYLMURAMOYL-L-ALANINE AMIDASE [Wolinella succinogenes]VEG81612.1 N-acetylmuramoyl-L-alanine amidase AmiC precursor [Wolinella succinogenes]HCZ18923.1 N-acetylmuramoyl-L-alanine amidase [Helicobacter sp.]